MKLGLSPSTGSRKQLSGAILSVVLAECSGAESGSRGEIEQKGSSGDHKGLHLLTIR